MMPEKGLRKCWTPILEMEFDYLLNGPNMSGPNCFARRHVITSLQDTLKYDGRTREGKRALASTRLRIATATNEELREISELWHFLEDDGSIEECLSELKQAQAEIRSTKGGGP